MKRFFSGILALVMMVAMIPGFVSSAKAATAGIENNGLYTIVSAYNGKALTQTDMSTFWADAVVWNTNAMSDLARWKLTERGEFYSITNCVSDKSMKICGTNPGDKCDYNGYDNSNNYKWKIVPITSGTYNGCFYIVSANKTGDNRELYAQIKEGNNDNNDGASVGLGTKSSNENSRQIWRIQKTSRQDTKFTKSMAKTMLDGFKNRYFKLNSNTGNTSLGWGFWSIAEIMEAMLDGYELTGDPTYKTMFEGTWKDFLARNGKNWSNNAYNDDLTWAALAGCRAYMLFGGNDYLTIAKENYDLMYNRASTYTVNGQQTGLLRWCEESDKRNTSNGCINGPAIVCAAHLAMATGDNEYWNKAKKIYEAQRNSNLYVATGNDAGYVRDCIKSDGSVQNGWCSTYNQGTYLGSAVILYNHFKDDKYKNDADNIAKYTMNHLCYNGILKEENTNDGDLSGFRGILVRYLRKYVLELDRPDYLDFFKKNALIAWMNRNSKNVGQCSWQKKASESNDWGEFAGYNVISLVANMPTYEDKVGKSASAIIEAEDMDYTRKLISENSNNTSGNRSLGGITDGAYTAYFKVDFGSEGLDEILVRYSRASQGSDKSASIEVRVGSANGEKIGTVNIADTGTWQDWTDARAEIKKQTGVKDIYLVFKSNSSYVCNLDYFTFEKRVVKTTYEKDGITMSDRIKILGFQISGKNMGVRTITSVENKEDGLDVVEYGNIIAIDRDNLDTKQMVVGSNNKYVKSFSATKKGIPSSKYSTSDTSIDYVRTITDNGATKEAFNQKYYMRGYVKLSDGKYVYGQVKDFTIFNVAKSVYEGRLMSNQAYHNNVYDNIIKVVEPGFKKINY